MTKRFASFSSATALCVLFLGIAPAMAEAGPHITLKEDQSLTGRFVHDHPVQGFDVPLRSEGRFSVSGKDRIVWAIEKPMATTTTLTPEGLTQSVGQFALLRLNRQQMPFLSEVQKNLLWALAGNWERLKGDFTITSVEEPAHRWTVTFVPKEKVGTRKPFQKIVAHGARFVEDADILLQNGVTDHVSFSETVLTPTAF
ncbi:MAG: hypothetical protein WC612_00375 [Bdellovibrionales bacterium]|jgi:hypothetical protein